MVQLPAQSPAGDGATVAGGDVTELIRHIDISAGDIDGNGTTNIQDIGPLRAGLGTLARSSGYSVFADLNGDGFIDAGDVAALRANLGRHLTPINPDPPIRPGSIHGLKWADHNANGRRDPGEPGIPGVTVYVDHNRNRQLDDGEPSAETMHDDPATPFDEAGSYWLLPVRPGRHVVREVIPDGFEQTFPGPRTEILGSRFETLHPGAALHLLLGDLGRGPFGSAGDGEEGSTAFRTDAKLPITVSVR